MLTRIPFIRPTRIIRSASVSSNPSRRACSVIRASSSNDENQNSLPQNRLSRRRSFVLNSTALPVVLGVIFDVGSKAPAPKLGVQEFNGIKSLTLCPPGSVNCLSTAEEMGTCVSFFASSWSKCVCVCVCVPFFSSFFLSSLRAANRRLIFSSSPSPPLLFFSSGQPQAYAPPWTFNPPESVRVLKQTQIYDVPTAKGQLIDIIKTTDCDGFTARIVEEYDDYVRATYTSPTLGFVDDVEFWFPRDERSTVEYTSRSRMGREDGGKNRNRIRTLRKALTAKYDWASVGF